VDREINFRTPLIQVRDRGLWLLALPRKGGIEMILAMSQADLMNPVIAIFGARQAASAQFILDLAGMIGVKVALPKPFAQAKLRVRLIPCDLALIDLIKHGKLRLPWKILPVFVACARSSSDPFTVSG
jgi:hypothetical protein